MLWYLLLLAGLSSTCKPWLLSRPSMARKHVSISESDLTLPLSRLLSVVLCWSANLCAKWAALDFVCALD